MGKTLNRDIQRTSNAFRGEFPDWKNNRLGRNQPTNYIQHQTYTDERVSKNSALISCTRKDIVFEDCTFIRCTFKEVDFQAGFHKCNFIECIFDGFSISYPHNGSIEFVHYAGFFNCKFTKCRFSETRTCEFFSITNCYFKECNCDEVSFLLFRNNAKIRCTNKKNREHISKFLESGMYAPTKPILPQNEIIGYKYAQASRKNHHRSASFLSNMVLVKLLIPKDSIRFCPDLNDYSVEACVWPPYRKCRCEKAKVLDITKLTGFTCDNIIKNLDEYNIQSPVVTGAEAITYEIGKEIKPDWFNMNPLTECTGGIHFFLTPEEAVRFAKRMK